jgi:hypothetical protein
MEARRRKKTQSKVGKWVEKAQKNKRRMKKYIKEDKIKGIMTSLKC